MSYLPITAHTQRMPAAPQPPGQSSVWRADVQPGFNHPQVQQSLGSHLDNSRPWINNPEALEHLVPASEREGTNEDGIPRKLAWLARNGFTVRSYEEIITAHVSRPPPNPSRRDLRKLADERKRIEHAKFEHTMNQLSGQSSQARKKAKQSGPAMVMAPRGEHNMWAGQPTSLPPRDDYSTLQPNVPHSQAADFYHEPTTSPDASTWLDQQQQQYDPALFLPEVALSSVPEAYGASGSGFTFVSEEQYGHTQAQPGYPLPYWDPNLPGGQALGEYSSAYDQPSLYPDMNDYAAYVGGIPVPPASQGNDSTYSNHFQQYW